MGRVRNGGKSITGSHRVQLMQCDLSNLASHANMKQHTKYSQIQILTDLEFTMPQSQLGVIYKGHLLRLFQMSDMDQTFLEG